MLYLLAASVSLATERPVLDEGADAVCPPRGLRAGVAYTPACDGVALSLARAQWLASMVPYADEQAAMRRIESAACSDDLERVAERADYWRTVAERPAPAALPPVVVLGIGVAGGIALSLGTAWAWGEVAR